MNSCLHENSSLLWTKVLGAFFLCLGLSVTGANRAGAAEPGPVISLVIDGKGISTDVQPIRENGRMLVPIRVVAESTGANVTYETANRQVTVTEKGKRIVLLVDSRTAFVDGKRVTMDAPAMIVNQRTVVPIRFVSEALGYQVVWDERAGVAQVQTKPVEDKAAVIQEASNPYVVQAGDTLTGIAERHHTTVQALKKNNYLSSDELTVQQLLFLPEGSKKSEHPLSTVGDSRLYDDSFYFPFSEATWYEPYGDSYGSDREWTESNSGNVRSHEGIDIMAPKGTPVYAVTDGTINRVGWNTYGGWRVNITDRAGRYRMYYAHLSAYAPGLAIGDTIRAGQLIGFVGDTGYGGTGTVGMFEPHLHFGLYKNSDGLAIDPYFYLRYWEQNKVESPFS
ncbi:stalk domain-containing protein [Brevibacillus choshinensis]|uniref:Peptidoglycan DD-metalloendopeptidase family protein n=1 Tax=Brevibacillus choshinensis TaxID=54911 RepID=A0ABX7FHT5_BRECH|nr:stalk domain-containing protein [Brevibacillus choshinensis]QRG65430.1 peptidoglycan DD-metalloendopeptidase family protein [Brevibacillus choshinensis]